MDRELLVDIQIDEGRKLLLDLVRSGIEIIVAAWIRTDEGKPWRLYIGTPKVDSKRSGDVYVTIIKAINRLPEPFFSSIDIKSLDSDDPFIKALKAIADRFPRGMSNSRFVKQELGNFWVEEAYIYPRISASLTRGEVIQALVGMMAQPNTNSIRSSTFVLRDDSNVVGMPYGLETKQQNGHGRHMEVKIFDDVDGSTREISVDDIVAIH